MSSEEETTQTREQLIAERDSLTIGFQTIIDATILRMRERNAVCEVSNFDMANKTDRYAALAMKVAEKRKINDNCPVTINAVYLSVQEAEQFNKNTGEIEGKFRTVIVDDAGEVWSTNSGIVSEVTLALIADPAMRRRFDPPLPMKFFKAGTLSGNSSLNCSIQTRDIDRIIKAHEENAKPNG